jgi:hypothetical protein
MVRANNPQKHFAGYFGAVSGQEAIGKATERCLAEVKDGAVNGAIAIEVPLDELKKIIAQHETP